MRIHRIAATAAAVLVAPMAHAQTCGLGVMASLDMTTTPEGRVTVPVSLNGTTYQFMVDTAGVFSKVSPDAVHQQNLAETPTSVELYGVKGKERLSSANIASLKLGNVELKSF